MMKKENVLASYLISLGEEVFRLLLAKGAKKGRCGRYHSKHFLQSVHFIG